MFKKKSGLVSQVAPDIESCKAGHDLQVNHRRVGNSRARKSALSNSLQRSLRSTLKDYILTAAVSRQDSKFPLDSAAEVL